MKPSVPSSLPTESQPPARAETRWTSFVLCSSVGVTGIALALAGDVHPGMAYLGLLFTGPIILWWIVSGLTILGRLSRRQPTGPLLSGLLLSVVALVALTRTVMGVPRWVKVRAEPFMTQLESWKAEHGTYPKVDREDFERGGLPEELRAPSKRAGCFSYLSDGASYRLTCSAVLFTSCHYDSARGTWGASN